MAWSGAYAVYIMSNFARTVFYTGVSNNLERRVWEHKTGEGGKFTSKYKCHFLVYFEEYSDVNNAISREKQLKNWQRKWKIELIRKENPDLIDLSIGWFGKDPGASPG